MGPGSRPPNHHPSCAGPATDPILLAVAHGDPRVGVPRSPLEQSVNGAKPPRHQPVSSSSVMTTTPEAVPGCWRQIKQFLS